MTTPTGSAMTWRGDWSAETAAKIPYVQGNVVAYKGSLWIVKARNARQAKPGTSEAWTPLGSQGLRSEEEIDAFLRDKVKSRMDRLVDQGEWALIKLFTTKEYANATTRYWGELISSSTEDAVVYVQVHGDGAGTRFRPVSREAANADGRCQLGYRTRTCSPEPLTDNVDVWLGEEPTRKQSFQVGIVNCLMEPWYMYIAERTPESSGLKVTPTGISVDTDALGVMIWRKEPWSTEAADERQYVAGHTVKHKNYVWVCQEDAGHEEPGTSPFWTRIGTSEEVGVDIPTALTALSPTQGGVPIGFEYGGPDPEGFELSADVSGDSDFRFPVVVASVDGSQRSLLHREAEPGQRVLYRVRAFDVYGNRGAWSRPFIYTVPQELLDTPSLGAQLLDQFQVALAWFAQTVDPRADRHDAYELQEKDRLGTGESNWDTIQRPAVGTNWLTMAKTEHHKYTYRIRSTRSSDEAVSPWSNEVEVTVSSVAPRNLKVVSINLDTAVISWEHSGAGGLTSFEVISQPPGAVSVTVAPDKREATIPFPLGTVKDSLVYPVTLVVVAKMAAIEDVVSSKIKVNFPGPEAPVVKSRTVTFTTISITWTMANTQGITFYQLSRKTGKDAWKIIANNLPPTQSEYADTDITPGTAYEYHMRAFASGVHARSSEPSNILSVKALLPQDEAPYNVQLERVEHKDDFEYELTWDYDHDVSQFEIKYSGIGHGTPKTALVLGNAEKKFTFRSPKPDFLASVTAHFSDGGEVIKSPPSASVRDFLTPLNGPERVWKAEHHPATDLTLRWTPVKHATGYRVSVSSTQRPYFYVNEPSWYMPTATSSAGYTVVIRPYRDVEGKNRRFGSDGSVGPGMMGKPFHKTPVVVDALWSKGDKQQSTRVEISFDHTLPIAGILVHRRDTGSVDFNDSVTVTRLDTGTYAFHYQNKPLASEWRASCTYTDGTIDHSVIVASRTAG